MFEEVKTHCYVTPYSNISLKMKHMVGRSFISLVESICTHEAHPMVPGRRRKVFPKKVFFRTPGENNARRHILVVHAVILTPSPFSYPQ